MTDSTVPPEADWDRAPSLVDGAGSLELTAAGCDLRYWLRAVPQGTLRGKVLGHDEDVRPHEVTRRPGPLNDALTQELAFRSVAEDKATRALGYLVALAPDTATLEFYTTQLMDEARHAMVFRRHLLSLGVAEHDLCTAVDRLAGADRDAVLVPLENLGLDVLRERRDFIGGVVVLTILVEGVLAPAAQLSELKWRVFDPAAADVERGAGIDEIRHLTVGSSIAREHLLARPEDRERLLELITHGRALWEKLPVTDMVLRRETLFQQGLDAHRDLVGDHEIWPGRRLADTTVEERLETAHAWAESMQRKRLAYMGLEEAI
ncbi:VlmB-like protein [Streptomyces roseirectus]|uniref:VlmB-like protein n=1 Tax=Streptomyces roseirectus TaxID=2768066 RepID=A0A7H0I839_9ACTN|nr:VlmB-like protein [Streptomyces roseirectus]QNP68955.1 VlmB-like protein [Streptomyces roseirectus]